ncbi:hypothetical protein ACFQ15_07270 [Sphingomonas hankookensis]|uniref:hypothetical protein n=1 Tax=Sphingomonas hankookensis TaxID=563996 RepID=UPI001F57EEED|nr:hypothetical protein [Sphingomonas hankookensis]
MSRRCLPLIALSCLVLVGCNPPTKHYSDAEMNFYEAALPGMTEECRNKLQFGGIGALPWDTDDCYKMPLPRRWQGLWRNSFESHVFCEAPATRCRIEPDADPQPPYTWIEFKGPIDPRVKQAAEGLYRIDFIGRKTVIPGNYGHLGLARHAIVVDRLLFIDRQDRSVPSSNLMPSEQTVNRVQ